MRVQHISGQYGEVVSVGLGYTSVRFDGDRYPASPVADTAASTRPPAATVSATSSAHTNNSGRCAG